MAADPTEFREIESLGDAARHALESAEVETSDLGHDWLGTEHLLLGLLATRGSQAARVLNDAGVTLAAARLKVGEAVGDRSGASLVPGPLPRTARAARALERAVRFSHQSRSDVVGTAHLLSGVIDVEGRAGQVLRRLGVDVNGLLTALEDSGPDEPLPVPEPQPARPGVKARTGASCSCGAVIDDSLEYRVVAARNEHEGPRDVLVFSCGHCGDVIGVAIE